jgi:predicted ABC-type transport system involved in lysophospholipase L1 biosynthesis ATPase subunit
MLSLVDISKSYGRGKRRAQILSEVSLSIAGGEILGILGSREEEGETLLEVAAGVVPPDKGQVRLDEMDVTRLSKAKRERLRCRHILWVDSRRPVIGIASKALNYVGLHQLAEGVSGREAARRAGLGLKPWYPACRPLIAR